jgi:phosphohistidine phosphatase
MKTLYVVRHAKSSWSSGVADFDRPLNDRGKRDAPAMAKRLRKIDDKIRYFISSPANRALSTCRFFCEAFDIKEKDIVTVDALYHASVETFKEVVNNLDDDFKRAVLFSHNPGITEFVNELTDEIRVDNMPTCAIFAVQADTKEWASLFSADKKFLLFDYPKKEA